MPVNSYGHVRKVSSPNHTCFLGKLDKAFNQYFFHIFSLVTDNNASWISRREENGRRNYFMIDLYECMGPSRDWFHDPQICSQTRICSRTRYSLRYTSREPQIAVSVSTSQGSSLHQPLENSYSSPTKWFDSNSYDDHLLDIVCKCQKETVTVTNIWGRASEFFQDWWAEVTHEAKKWWVIFWNDGPKHIKLTTVDIWVVYLIYTQSLTQTL